MGLIGTMISIPIRLQRLFGLLLAIAGAGYLLVHVIDTVRLATATPPIHSDFHAIWSYARIVIADGGAAVYDAAHLWQAELALGRDPARPAPLPFAYPPHFLLLIAPLAWLDYAPAYLVWVLITAVMFVVGVAGLRTKGVLVLLAPAATAAIIYGQTGMLAAGLLVGALRAVPTRPVLAGVLFGIASCKPQLGLLIPVALLALGQWRVILVASLTVLTLVLVTSSLWGVAIWSDWLAVLPAYSQRFDAEMGPYWYLVPTVKGVFHQFGAPAGVARMAQLLVALPVLAATWLLFRRAAYPVASAGLLIGTFLVTPHAFVYDLPLAAAGVYLFWNCQPAFDARAAAVMLAVLVAPALMMAVPAAAFLALLAHAALFATLLRAVQTPKIGLSPHG